MKTGDELPTLAEVIDHFWDHVVQPALAKKLDLSNVPDSPGQLTLDYMARKVKQSTLRFSKSVSLGHLEKRDARLANEVLKLFDASGNAYRSLTNVLLYFKRLESELEAGEYTLAIADYATIDGVSLVPVGPLPNASLCPICRRFEHTRNALALITGNPQTDSAFATNRFNDNRANMKICDYCFLSGYVDLPVALITKIGQNVSKGREYLFVTSPFAHDDLRRLLDFISERSVENSSDLLPLKDVEENETIEEKDDVGYTEEVERIEINQQEIVESEEEKLSLLTFTQFLREKYGVEEYERLAVLGMSRKRLRQLHGFVLPVANGLSRIAVLRVPVERLVGEVKISSAVRRELVKATMYDFWQVTGGSLHYNRVTEAPFSVDGQTIESEEMYRANVAYRIADRYARVGRYRQLNSGLFMLLLSNPREAANRILRAKRREKKGQYAPGVEKTMEVIKMTEELAQQDDWQFELGLKIVELLVSTNLTERARSFWRHDNATGAFGQYSGVDLVKWIQRIKMVRDPSSARIWGTSLINGYKRTHGNGPNTVTVERILGIVEEIIEACENHNKPLGEFSRQIANMDYYLLFYYNQRRANQQSEGEKS
jgi:hypothetical protein